MSAPDFTPGDSIFADVFFPLDGIWEGTFQIYKDPNGQTRSTRQPVEIPGAHKIKTFTKTDEIKVRQEYESKSPYFQRVKITDQYDKNGDTRVVESTGVNKVQDGLLWCVVEKPDETVVHQGQFIPPATIIWSRHEKLPLKKEYFRETISDDKYTILGYGYYGNDDPDLNPKTWFVGEYQAVMDYER